MADTAAARGGSMVGLGVAAEPVGRHALLSEARRVLAEGGAAEFVGQPGAGKTTVWDAVVRSATDDVALSFVCQEAEAGFGLGAVADLLGSAVAAAGPPCVSRLPPLLGTALEVVTLRRAPQDLAVPLDARLVGSTLTATLTLLAGGRPVLVAIDDLQWCDGPSFAALRYTALRTTGGTGGRVRWLTARRPDTEQSLPGAAMLEVPPLPLGALRDLLESRLGMTFGLPTLRAVAAASGGNPLYALEIARSLPVDATPEDVRLPPTLVELVRRRVEAMPGRTREALLDVAVRGGVDVRYERLGDLDSAFDAGIVQVARGRSGFTHPLLATGLLDGASPAARARAHARAAEAASDPVVRARHLASATLRADEVVAKELDVAVELAGTRGDAAGAAWLAQRALELSTTSQVPWRRIAAAAHWSAITYSPTAVALARRMATAATTGTELARAALQESYALVGNVRQALEALNAGLGVSDVDDEVRARMLIQQSRLLLNLGHLREATIVLAEALPVVESGSAIWAGLVGDLSLLQRTAGVAVDYGLLEQAADVARTRHLPRPFNPLVNLGIIAMWDDRHADARSAYLQVVADATGTNFDDEARFHLAELDIRVGALSDAAQAARKLVAGAEGQDLAGQLWLLAMASAWQGDDSSCREAARRCRDLAATTGDALFWIGSIVALGFLELMLEHHAEAWRLLAQASGALSEKGMEEPSCFPAVPLAIEAAVAVGDVSAAAGLVARLERQATLLDSRWARTAAVRSRGHLLARGDFVASAALFHEAAEGYRELGLPLERARCLLARGTLLRQHGMRKAARDDLGEALIVFAGSGAAIMAETCRREIGRLGGRASNPAGLTFSERQVAELVAVGVSNADVAARLHVSVKTVESHLTRVYRKLGVRSRAALAATLTPAARK